MTMTMTITIIIIIIIKIIKFFFTANTNYQSSKLTRVVRKLT